MSLERLQKVMAAAGVASRRASEDLIAAGRVTVNGDVAELGRKVDGSTDDIRVDGERINADPDLVHVMLNKPRGVVTTADDPEGRPTVVEMVDLPVRLFPVGRLDKDTEGLLLLTNDGELTHQLLHPSREVERTYVALVNGPVRRHTLQQLRDGVALEDGTARPTEVVLLEEQHNKVLLQLTMTEGRKREIRRMLAAVDHPVERLARVAFAGVELGDLRQGRWRHLTQQEVGRLHAAVEGRSGAPRSARSTRDERRRRARQDRNRDG